MNRDNMSHAQLIALVKELEAQNAELRARISDDCDEVLRRSCGFRPDSMIDDLLKPFRELAEQARAIRRDIEATWPRSA